MLLLYIVDYLKRLSLYYYVDLLKEHVCVSFHYLINLLWLE